MQKFYLPRKPLSLQGRGPQNEEGPGPGAPAPFLVQPWLEPPMESSIVGLRYVASPGTNGYPIGPKMILVTPI